MIWPERPTPDWLGVEDACRRVLALVAPLPAEDVHPSEALGRTLAEPLIASATLPPWDNSAMDGYALHGSDVAGAGQGNPILLHVVGEARAGAAWPGTLARGQAIRIMTGAPIPLGADTVVRVEDTDREATPGTVRVTSDRDRGRNLRPAGQDVRPGEVLVEAGMPVGPAELAAIAASGATRVRVHRAPRVGVLTSGDELRDPDRFDDVRAGRGIPDTNGPFLVGAARTLGCKVRAMGPARDDARALRDLVDAASASDLDLLITVGGASMGGTDLFREVLASLGIRPDFWRVRMRPGSPFSAGLLPRPDGALPVLGLPGNPASAFVTFHLLARAALLRLSGRTQTGLPFLRVRAGARLAGGGALTHFLRVRLESHAGSWVAVPTGPQGSGLVSGLARADALAVVPEGTEEIAEGAEVGVHVLRPPTGAAA